MTVLDEDLLDAVGPGRRVCWAGTETPLPHFTAAPELYDPERDFRLAPDQHGTFDAVYLTERDLGTIKQWPLVLDEALRLLADGGLLFVRFTDGVHTSIFALMNLLSAWSDGVVEIRSERTWPDNPQLFQLCLAVRRTRSLQRVRSITFGVITDGRKPDSVSRFVESVMRLQGLQDVESEVVVCGPAGCTDHLVIGAGETRLVEQPEEFAAQGWITRKKNLVVQAARGDVVVVAHDRYELAPDFLVELQAFGGDFSVVVCRQETLDGRRFPDWVSIGAAWNWAAIGMLAYGDWEPGHYVNGGVMIARRDVLAAHPWNDLLFWNQAEDVELSRRFLVAGVVPRLARRVVARTALSREDQMSAFEVLPDRPHTYARPGAHPRYRLGTRVSLAGLAAVDDARAEGLVLAHGWEATEDRPRWHGHGDPEFAVTVLPLDAPGSDLELRVRLSETTPPGAVVAVRVNGHLLDPLPTDDPAWLRGVWPEKLVPLGHTARIELLTVGNDPVELEEFVLDVTADNRWPVSASLPWGVGRPAVPGHAGGWGAPEDWGRWTVGAHSWLRLPLSTTGAAVRLVTEVMAMVPPDSGEQRVVVTVGGAPLDIWVFRESMQRESRELHIPARLVADGWLDLEFSIASPSRPATVGTNPHDWRPLGLGLCSLTVTAARDDR